jgi:hypothetical protein
MKKRLLWAAGILFVLFECYVHILVHYGAPEPNVIMRSLSVGDSVDSYNGISVYNNGAVYSESHGRHFSRAGFYYGKKWQCVEFIKHYYHDHFNFTFRNGYGHAKDFFNPKVRHGKLNRERNLLQYKNDSTEKPRPDDILVFGGNFGHVAIVTRVTADEVEVIQQNIYMRPRQKFPLKCRNGIYSVGEGRRPLGWLRMR